MGPWVAELHACWEHVRNVAGGLHTVVNLSDVTFIDESGEKLLSEMARDGAEFVAAGVETKHLLEHLKAEGEHPRRLNVLLAKRGEKQHVTKHGRDE